MATTNNYFTFAKSFLKQFENYHVIPSDQLAETLKKAKNGDSSSISQIVCSHQKFIIYTARKYGYLNDSISEDGFDDLMMAGTEGLMDAIRLYDEKKGSPFLTCAEFNIRNRLSENARLMCQPIHLPKQKAQKLNEIRQLLHQNGIKCSDSKAVPFVSEYYGISKSDAKEILGWDFKFQPIVIKSSDDDEMDSSDEYSVSCYMNNLIDDSEEKAINAEISNLVSKAIRTLDSREQKIIRMYYGFDDEAVSCSEIGKRLNLTRQRVHQILRNAEEKMRTGQKSVYLEGLAA